VTLGRRAGLMVPLFSLRSERDWGIGEIGDLPAFCRWLSHAGQRVLQLLPINELPDHETSPYSALSGMAIDPRFISLDDLPDFPGIGALSPVDQQRLRMARAAGRVDYASVRAVKGRALRLAFEHFSRAHDATRTTRAASLDAFVARESWWLESYALFRALFEEMGATSWTSWPTPVRDRHPDAVAAARARLAPEVRYRQYLQWVADEQWRAARRAVRDVALLGDLPFMVATGSADVWSRQHEFRLDASLGVPPDAFSETGQDWNLPVYRWDVVQASGFEWLRQRARRNADLFDGYRVDHLVGFFRTFYREPGGVSGFTPALEADQRALGERVLQLFLESGAAIIAEDLGVVPDFVRESMARLGVPGCKVFRWERQWHVAGQPFVDPATYAARSVATTGTHDTEPMATWWRRAPLDERRAVVALPSIAATLGDDRAADGDLCTELREAILDAVAGAGSDTVIVPVQDAFGWDDRINTPAVVDDINWTWRLPWTSEAMTSEATSVAAALLRLSTRHARTGASNRPLES
jgi:4-alpha-glucanotransferase